MISGLVRRVNLFALAFLTQPAVGWAMGRPPGDEGGKSPGGTLGLFAPMILVFVIFYLLLIRPQARQAKRHREILGKIQRGDEIVTSAGIHGKITSVAEELVTLEIADNVRIKLDKKQVAAVKSSAAEAKKT